MYSKSAGRLTAGRLSTSEGEAARQRVIFPDTIVRATQFFEFMGGIAQFSTVGRTVHLSPTRAQPIAADDVAGAVAEVTLCAPMNGMIEIAGPERAGLDELARRYRSVQRDDNLASPA